MIKPIIRYFYPDAFNVQFKKYKDEIIDNGFYPGLIEYKNELEKYKTENQETNEVANRIEIDLKNTDFLSVKSEIKDLERKHKIHCIQFIAVNNFREKKYVWVLRGCRAAEIADKWLEENKMAKIRRKEKEEERNWKIMQEINRRRWERTRNFCIIAAMILASLIPIVFNLCRQVQKIEIIEQQNDSKSLILETFDRPL